MIEALTAANLPVMGALAWGGRLCRDFAGRRFFQPVRLKDAFCLIGPEGYRSTLIDRETSKPWPSAFTRRRSINALARAYRPTIRDGYPLTRRDIQQFIHGFLAALPGAAPLSPRTCRRRIYQVVKNKIKTFN